LAGSSGSGSGEDAELQTDQPRKSSRSRPRTQIEGMDAIQRYEESHVESDDNLTEAEKQMRDEEISFYSNSENEYGDDNIWGLLSGVGGNIYEW